MYNETHLPDVAHVYFQKYQWFNEICLWFHMPIFTFISGGVYGYLWSMKGKYRNFLPFIKQKAKRLLLPYIIFGCVFMASVNILSLDRIIGGAYAHLWFLTMLFWCFVITAIINQFNFSTKIWFKLPLLVISFILLCYARTSWAFLGLQNSYKWFFWFYLGFVIYNHRDIVYKWIKRTKILPFILPLIYGGCMYYMITFIGDYGAELKCFTSEFGFLSIVIWIWWMLCWVIERFDSSWTQCRLIRELSTCSFGIYIFHAWIIPFMISKTAKNIFPLTDWAANHTILFPLIFSLLALLISYIMTKIFLMTKIGRSLIG